jgi:hypothetical protein
MEIMTTLLLSARHTEDNQQLWRAAIERGWTVERVRGLRIPEMSDAEFVLYIEALFAPTIAKALGLRLLEPALDWLTQVPHEFRRRDVWLSTLGEARTLSEPRFVKPPNEKSFSAQVYGCGDELPAEFDDSTPVLVAEPVEWEVEVRCFVLDGTVRTLSPYLRCGQLAKHDGFLATEDELQEARRLVETLLADSRVQTPRAVVVDVGKIAGRGWAVVEANAAWGSGIYGCDPHVVLEVIRHAVVPA